jgi:amino acid permease
MTTAETIEYQNGQIKTAITKMGEEKGLYAQKYNYQSRQYASLNKINSMLKYVYYLLLIIITLFIIYKYLARKRTYTYLFFDILMLLVFVLFPFFIHKLEEMLYEKFVYIATFIKNNAFPENLYTFFGNTNFYEKPNDK